MKRLLLSIVALFATVAVQANIYDIAKLGGVNDGVADNTEIIQSAIQV